MAVYVLLCQETGRFKVGYSSNTVSRVANIIDSSPTDVVCVGEFSDGDRALESKIHKGLSHWRIPRSRGRQPKEWFYPTPDSYEYMKGNWNVDLGEAGTVDSKPFDRTFYQWDQIIPKLSIPHRLAARPPIEENLGMSEVESALGKWLHRCSFENPKSKTRTMRLWESWVNWLKGTNIDPQSQRWFVGQLKMKGFKYYRTKDERGLVGLGLRTTPLTDDAPMFASVEVKETA